MSHKTPPYVISFEDIQPGDTIEAIRKSRGITNISKAVVAYLADDWWRTAEDGHITFRGEDLTLRLLDRPEPPKPELPTEVRSVVLVDGTPWSLKSDGRWWDLDSTRYLTQAEMAEKHWTLAKIVPADDPTTPKSNDGLREQVEKLVEGLTRNGGYHAGPITTTNAARVTGSCSRSKGCATCSAPPRQAPTHNLISVWTLDGESLPTVGTLQLQMSPIRT